MVWGKGFGHQVAAATVDITSCDCAFFNIIADYSVAQFCCRLARISLGMFAFILHFNSSFVFRGHSIYNYIFGQYV
jgi:hypothetical protein